MLFQAVQRTDRSPWAFDEIKGCDEAKHELQEMVELMKFPEQLSGVKAHPPKGVLLVGPPGEDYQWLLTFLGPPFPPCPSDLSLLHPPAPMFCQCLAHQQLTVITGVYNGQASVMLLSV